MSSEIVFLQQLHNLHDDSRVIYVMNIVHYGHCQQNDLQRETDIVCFYYISFSAVKPYCVLWPSNAFFCVVYLRTTGCSSLSARSLWSCLQLCVHKFVSVCMCLCPCKLNLSNLLVKHYIGIFILPMCVYALYGRLTSSQLQGVLQYPISPCCPALCSWRQRCSRDKSRKRSWRRGKENTRNF